MSKKLVQRQGRESEVPKSMDKNLISGADFTRLANNFYNSMGYSVDYNRLITDSQLGNYISQNAVQKKYKIAFTFICLNPLYWQFANEMVQGARKFFLPGHETDFFFWTDIPEKQEDVEAKLKVALAERGIDLSHEQNLGNLRGITQGITNLKTDKNIKIIPTEAIEWPFPTLLRYNLFLQQEEALKEYDYIFYCDIDMIFVNVVGDEILGDGLTSAQHPMYALRKEYWPPYEPNNKSEAYIPRPGKIIGDNGKPRFMPLYYAGGFQGGKSDKWIEAMKEMKKMTDKDLSNNYIPIWNDESIWNKYLFLNPPSVVLSPSYIYPDSLVKEYYEPVWGCSYIPKLMTLTKWFTLSKEGGAHVAKISQELKR